MSETLVAHNQTFHEFADRQALARELALTIFKHAEAGALNFEEVLIAFSGGSTPKTMLTEFFRLAEKDNLDFTHTTITLIDERCVLPESDRSNLGMLLNASDAGSALAGDKTEGITRDPLSLRGGPFVPLYFGHEVIDANCRQAEEWIERESALPVTIAVLGMGTDGHTASWFPNAKDINALTAPLAEAVFVPAFSSDGEARITMPLARIVEADRVVLHIEGREKLAVLNAALEDGDADDLPIRHILRARDDIEIFWAP